MQIKVHKVKSYREIQTDKTGGEYGVLSLDIYVDRKLSKRTQRSLIIHSVIENFARSWVHPKVEELTSLIDEALEQL